MKLDSRTVAALKLDGKTDAIFFDDALPGFGFRLRRNGDTVRRTWVVQWKRGGRSCRVTLGRAEVLGIEAARKAAKKVLGEVAIGKDPVTEARARDAANRNTLRSLLDQYLAARQPELRPRSFTETRRYLTGGYFKPLHNLPIDTIRRADVAANVVRIARESGAPTAREARGALSTFFTWAMQMGLAESNPTIGAFRPKTNGPRERVLSDDELARVWRACDDGTEYGKIVRLLILTGCRRQEVGDIAWSELSPDGTWTIPGGPRGRSKNKRPHTLPVLPMMREIIDSVPQMATRDQLFGLRSHGFTNWTLPKPDLDRRSGVENFRLHDIRRSVATKMADIGVLPHVVEAVLNHQSGHKRGVAGVYNKSPYTNEVRAALATWHDRVRVLVTGGERRVLNFQPTTAAAT